MDDVDAYRYVGFISPMNNRPAHREAKFYAIFSVVSRKNTGNFEPIDGQIGVLYRM